MQTLSPWLPCSAGLTLQVVLWHSQMGWLPPDPALSLLRVWITTSKPPPQHTYTGYTCKSHRSWSTEGCPGPPPKTLPPAQVQTDLSDPEMILLHSFLNLPFALIVSLSCSFLDLHRLYFQTGYHQRISPEKERGFALLSFGTSQMVLLSNICHPCAGARSPTQPPRQGGDCLMVFQLVETNRSLLLASRTMSRPT